MSQSVYRHVHRVTYADCTLGNHIYYARYLDLLEAARGEFFRHLGQPFLKWQEQGVLFPVIECRIRYHGPARYDDVLTIELWPTRAERVRLNFTYRVMDPKGAVLVEAETCHVCTSIEEKPRRLPEELRVALEPWVEEADSEE